MVVAKKFDCKKKIENVLGDQNKLIKVNFILKLNFAVNIENLFDKVFKNLVKPSNIIDVYGLYKAYKASMANFTLFGYILLVLNTSTYYTSKFLIDKLISL